MSICILKAMDQGTPDAAWEFELGSPNLLMLNGWKIDTIRAGRSRSGHRIPRPQRLQVRVRQQGGSQHALRRTFA